MVEASHAIPIAPLIKGSGNKQVTQLLNRIATKDDVDKHLTAIEETLDSHTTTLEGIAKNTKHWTDEAAALRSAINRHERWIADLAKKIGLNLKDLKSDSP